MTVEQPKTAMDPKRLPQPFAIKVIWLLVISALFVIVLAAVLLPAIPQIQFSRIQQDGVALFRRSPDAIYLTWNMESGVTISPYDSLDWYGSPVALQPPREHRDEHYRLTGFEDLWMFDLAVYNPDFPLTYAGLINPKSANAEAKIHKMIRAVREQDWKTATKLAADHYVFFGWQVHDEAEVLGLAEALRANWDGIDRSKPLSTSTGVLQTLHFGMEKFSVNGPVMSPEAGVDATAIPVMMERLSPVATGRSEDVHVLYLDGHVEKIPFGEQFPATRGVIRAIFPTQNDEIPTQ